VSGFTLDPGGSGNSPSKVGLFRFDRGDLLRA
jgi:hypothetical protein